MIPMCKPRMRMQTNFREVHCRKVIGNFWYISDDLPAKNALRDDQLLRGTRIAREHRSYLYPYRRCPRPTGGSTAALVAQDLRGIRRDALPGATYTFGSQGTVVDFDYGEDFGRTVWEIGRTEFEPAVELLSSSPERIEQFRRMADRLSEPEIVVFMNREPELGKAIGVLRERISQAASALERYQRSASPDLPSRGTREYFNVEGPMKEAMDRALDRAAERNRNEAMEQACIALRWVVLANYELHRWLVDRATRVERRKP